MDQRSRYRPSNALQSLQSEVNRLFDDILPGREGGGRFGTRDRMWTPPVDVMETDKGYRLRVDLPGVARENITIDAEDNRLTIRGERPAETQKKSENTLHTERAVGSFHRSLTLPTTISPDKAKANFRNGVLIIDLPKVAKSKSKAISIS